MTSRRDHLDFPPIPTHPDSHMLTDKEEQQLDDLEKCWPKNRASTHALDGHTLYTLIHGMGPDLSDMDGVLQWEQKAQGLLAQESLCHHWCNAMFDELVLVTPTDVWTEGESPSQLEHQHHLAWPNTTATTADVDLTVGPTHTNPLEGCEDQDPEADQLQGYQA